MNGRVASLLTGFAVLSLAACATTPQQRYASSIKAAEAADRPVVIYQMQGATTFERTKLRPPATVQLVTYVGVGFINTSAQPIRKLVFNFGLFKNRQLVLSSDGKPVAERDLVASEAIMPGSSGAVIEKIAAVSFAHPVPSGCPGLVGIEVTYQDGTTRTVTGSELSYYAVPNLNTHCAFANDEMPRDFSSPTWYWPYGGPYEPYGSPPGPSASGLTPFEQAAETGQTPAGYTRAGNGSGSKP